MQLKVDAIMETLQFWKLFNQDGIQNGCDCDMEANAIWIHCDLDVNAIPTTISIPSAIANADAIAILYRTIQNRNECCLMNLISRNNKIVPKSKVVTQEPQLVKPKL